MKTFLLAAALALFAAAPAHAIVIDFEDQPYAMPDDDGNDPLGGTLEISAGGLDITFAGDGLKVAPLGDDFDALYGTKYLGSRRDSAAINVTFGGATVDSVSVMNPINGRASSEIDFLTLTAFDSLDNVIGSYFGSDEIASIAATGIFRLLIDDDFIFHTDDASGYLVAKIAFNEVLISPEDIDVPEPAALAFLGLGFGALLYRRRPVRLTNR